MRPVSETPTETTDYAALSLAYGSLLAALAASGRHKASIGTSELVPLSAATFALSKLVVHEKVETWLRAPFIDERSDDRRPKGRRLRYAVGELLSCTRCVGAWSALALIGLRVHAPATGRLATTVLATSAGNDFLHAGFSLLCAGSNRQDAVTERLQQAA